MLNSIGPVWDGNEVWLVLGGGVLFAAFPIVYAALFSGFYVAIMLVLLALILRTVAIEFRSKRSAPRWRALWDAVFSLPRWGWPCCWASPSATSLPGVPAQRRGQDRDRPGRPAEPFALLIGVTAVAMLAMHGALYLNPQDRGRAAGPGAGAAAPADGRVRRARPLAVIAWRSFGAARSWRATWRIWPLIFPLGALVALVGAWRFVRRGRAVLAFICSAATIALLIISVAVGMYPTCCSRPSTRPTT